MSPEAFDRELEALTPRLRAFAVRMLANHADAADAVQDALAKAIERRTSFRGDAAVSTWVFSILTRLCLDRLRHRQRWRWDAQELTRRDPEADHAGVLAILTDAEHGFDVREHIAFCFSCVARSLPPEEAAAVLLREVFGYSNQEAARICGVSESVLRHRLSAGRGAMQDAFEKLCALVNKQGVCYQCAGFRERTPPERRGEVPPELGGPRDEGWRRRLRVIDGADLDAGRSAKLHRFLFEAVQRSEARRDGRAP